MTVALSAFYPYALPYVIGAPEPLLERAVRDACIAFCEDTSLIQDITIVNVVADRADYEVDTPSMSKLTKVLRVFYRGEVLTPSPTEMITVGQAFDGSGGVSAPKTYFQKTPTSADITLYPTPEESVLGGLVIRAAYAPLRTATQVDETLFQDWAEAIGKGAAAMIMDMPGQPYSNPGMSMSLSAAFQAAISSASIQARRGMMVTASRVQPRPFA